MQNIECTRLGKAAHKHSIIKISLAKVKLRIHRTACYYKFAIYYSFKSAKPD